MKHTLFTYTLLGTLALAFTSCKQKQAVASTEAPKAITSEKSAQEKDQVVLKLKKTPCFGQCPIFEAEIYASGKVSYIGKNFVDNIGTFEGKMDKQLVADLVNDAVNAGFFDLEDDYPSKATDFPSRYITVTHNGKTKTVRCEAGGPEGFNTIEKLLDTHLKDVEFTSVQMENE